MNTPNEHSQDVGQPWVEKYRPRTLYDIVGNRPAMDRLRAMAESLHMTNLILAGPPGCGKTTSVSALARHLVGDEAMSTAVLELNASDDRGIDVVRGTIKTFASQKITLPPGKAQHKIVILDEADAMTEAAQQAMRRTMEVHSSTTRFALACNTSTKIIEPIQSRCAIVRFSKLSDAEIMSKLQDVANKENLTILDDAMEALIFSAEGDMRAALNNLQSTASGLGPIVTSSNVFKVCDQPQPGELRLAAMYCKTNQWIEAFGILNKIAAKGYPVGDIISSLARVIKQIEDNELPEAIKLEFLKEIAVCQFRMSEGLHTRVQLAGVIGAMCEANEVLRLRGCI